METPVWGKFAPEYPNYLNLNLNLNSMVTFVLAIFAQKCCFRANLIQKIETICLGGNMISGLIWICFNSKLMFIFAGFEREYPIFE